MNGHHGLDGLVCHSFFIPEKMVNLNDFLADTRASRHKANKIKQDTESRICQYIKKQMRGTKIHKQVLIVFNWSEQNKMRDPDNICFAKKFILDALVKSEVLTNDGWGQVFGFNDRFKVDKHNIGVLVEMYEVEE